MSSLQTGLPEGYSTSLKNVLHYIDYVHKHSLSQTGWVIIILFLRGGGGGGAELGFFQFK